MSGWNFADAWEAIAETIPDAPALVHGPTRRTWRELDRRADSVARSLLGAGLAANDKVAVYLPNRPEYLETLYASFKAGLTPVNTNYRYGAEELTYLWTNADVGAVVFAGRFGTTAAAVRPRVPHVRLWLWVDDGTEPCPAWAEPYEPEASDRRGRARSTWGRSGDDLLLLYTGGTTGKPKGVMWRQDDLFVVLNRGAPRRRRLGATVDLDLLRSVADPAGVVTLPASPLMHGAGCFAAMTALSVGGSVVTLPGERFSGTEVLDTVERERVTSLSIVGDAFAKPLLRCLDERPGRWDLSSLKMIVSSGVMWSEPVKHGLLRHRPELLLVDTLGSSEAVGMARSVTSAAATTSTAAFALGPDTQVLADDGTPVRPGSGERGRVALRGRLPIGYYKDDEASARTFVEVGGERWSVPGDYATVEADGTIRLLGRGSGCINTGGEKVFPEEVEEVIKSYDAVVDVAVVGLPHDEFGEMVVAVVESDAALDEQQLIEHVKARLAAYKAPRHVVVVDSIGRSAAGKLDYPALRERAGRALEALR